MSAYENAPAIMVAMDFDLPPEKRRAYAMAALDEITVARGIIYASVIHDGWLKDTPDDCDSVATCDDLTAWLKARDAELLAEMEALRQRLRVKWASA